MRRIVVLSTLLLTITGLWIYISLEYQWLTAAPVVVLLHVWAGFFYLVIFPMYAWDHISTHRRRLKRVSWVSSSGVIQLLSGVGILLSGVLLLLYERRGIPLFNQLHCIFSLGLCLSLGIHFLIKK